MLVNKPYIYLIEDDSDLVEEDRFYEVHVAILLQGYKIDPRRIVRNDNDGLDPHENEKRLDANHPYRDNTLRRSVVRILLDKDEDHTELWCESFRFTYAQVSRGSSNQSDFVQVIAKKSDGDMNHDGSSSGHYGDPD